MLFVMPVVRTLKGSVSRVGAASESFPVLVNGRRVSLRVLHAKGRLADAKGSEELEFRVLDDPDNPLLLSSSGPGFSTRITRIEFPEPPSSATSIESTLAAHQPVDIYGIYFAFGSATLRPESDRVLKEVADLLGRHRDWRLQVDGHTDNIGGDAANLDLSRRRAAAVKAALVQRYAIAADRLATGGFGEARPKDRNDTIEGRALNRRVELRRL
jgi:outer membrane protein OmpA-like peptidoglycan-associated protein